MDKRIQEARLGEDFGLYDKRYNYIDENNLGVSGRFGFKRTKNACVYSHITEATTTPLWSDFFGGYLYVEEIVISALGDGTNNQTITIMAGTTTIAKLNIEASGVTTHRLRLRMEFSRNENIRAITEGSGDFEVNVMVMGHEKPMEGGR